MIRSVEMIFYQVYLGNLYAIKLEKDNQLKI